MNIACIVQARLRSSRLPGKTMLMLPSGRTVVNEVLHRCCLINGVDRVVAALPDGNDCDVLEHHIKNVSTPKSVIVIRGSENDVLSRYALAAQTVNADIVMRVTADCPCLDHNVCSNVLQKLIDENLDYCSNVFPRTYPDGYDCEVFTRAILEEAASKATHQMCREHVTPYFNGKAIPVHGWFPTEQMENVKRGNVRQDIDEHETMLTIDTIDDYIRICKHMMNKNETHKYL